MAGIVSAKMLPQCLSSTRTVARTSSVKPLIWYVAVLTVGEAAYCTILVAGIGLNRALATMTIGVASASKAVLGVLVYTSSLSGVVDAGMLVLCVVNDVSKPGEDVGKSRCLGLVGTFALLELATN